MLNEYILTTRRKVFACYRAVRQLGDRKVQASYSEC